MLPVLGVARKHVFTVMVANHCFPELVVRQWQQVLHQLGLCGMVCPDLILYAWH